MERALIQCRKVWEHRTGTWNNVRKNHQFSAKKCRSNAWELGTMHAEPSSCKDDDWALNELLEELPGTTALPDW